MGGALTSGLFGAFSALEWTAEHADTNPVASLATLAILALISWRVGHAAKRRAEAIEGHEHNRQSRENGESKTTGDE